MGCLLEINLVNSQPEKTINPFVSLWVLEGFPENPRSASEASLKVHVFLLPHSRGLQGHDLPISMEVNAGGMKMVEEGDSL